MADETPHPRPAQSEEPEEDIGASNVDLDESRHSALHDAPAAPEPGHEPDDHGAHDDHDDHPTDDPRWVLAPLAVGVVLAIVVLVIVGLQSDASPLHQL